VPALLTQLRIRGDGSRPHWANWGGANPRAIEWSGDASIGERFEAGAAQRGARGRFLPGLQPSIVGGRVPRVDTLG